MTQLGIFERENASADGREFDPFLYAQPDGDEIEVDSFAGGGGASEGIRRALGHSPHKAINHDPPAIALHSANHPDSEHFQKNVWRLDPLEVCGGRPVGLMWLSPDCTHFSKAKGSKPVSKKIRGLAWVAVRWAKAVQPRIIILENVEEFEKWGPLHADDHRDPKLRGRPIVAKQGRTYRAFVRKLERLGYVVESRQLVACDFGAPTSRKRLFIIARCDGESIVWPAPTHGPGRAHPWRTAAECIDWSIPCPSIFITKKEAKSLGFNVKRPLVENTLRRIGRGVWRFVINNPKPFIVPMQHANRPTSVDEPLQTVTTQGNKFNLVAPTLVEYHAARREGDDRARTVGAPIATLDTSNRFGLVAPFLAPVTHPGDQRVHSIEEPVRTITGANRGEEALIAATLVQSGYGEDKNRNGGIGQPPRALDIEKPLGTVVGSGKHALVSAFLAKHFGGHETPGSDLFDPMSSVTGRDHHAFVAAHIQRDFGKSVGAPADTPLQTITGGAGGHAAVVASSLVKLYGTTEDGQRVEEPMPTVSAQGNHIAEVRAFLIKYYGTAIGQPLLDPMHTVTSDDRFGVVTVHGMDYVIVDIGMRMLAPRELARAQGFKDSYILDIQFNGKPLSKEAQTSMIGNSVPPDDACALVKANYRPRTVRREQVA